MNDYGIRIAIKPSLLEGEIAASPSKSQTHRALICATLASGVSTIHNPLLCDDTEATLKACQEMGGEILAKNEQRIVIRGTGGKVSGKNMEINCGESGSTLRFILPIAAVSNAVITFYGKKSLVRRPIGELLSVLEKLGSEIAFIGEGNGLPLKIKGNGTVSCQSVEIKGDVSSQFISGLLFALPLIRGGGSVSVTTDLESRDYVELTLDVLKKFGIVVEKSEDMRTFKVPGGQEYREAEFWVEGDYSSSSFFLVAGAISGGENGVTITNLDRNSKQGDKRILDILKEMGANITVTDSSITVKKSVLTGCRIDARDIPDLVPILSIAGARAKGTTRIDSIGRLRLKESDRVSGIKQILSQFGCSPLVEGDSIIIKGSCNLESNNPLNLEDHRLVMSACIGSLVAKGETLIGDPSVVKKSYPDFFEHLRKLGGDIMTVSNTLGNTVRLTVIGESHGRRIGALLEGIPKGISISREYIQEELEKRRSTSLLTTTRREPDIVEIISGIHNEKTTGGTIRLEIKNRDVKSEFYDKYRDLIRPGHADYTARQKYRSLFDFRGGGFLSGRMTASFVAAGAVTKKILESRGIKILSHIVQIGKVKLNIETRDEDVERGRFPHVVKCVDPETALKMEKEIISARQQRDSVGGVVECRILGLPIGVGEPIFYSLESVISQAMFSIPAVKGIEFGSGFMGSGMRGSENNDPVAIRNGKIITLTNNAGGILGGLSNGMPVVFRVAIKPTSSIAKEQRTVDYSRLEEAEISVKGRHDACIAVRAPPVIEAMAALAITDLMMTGGFIDKD